MLDPYDFYIYSVLGLEEPREPEPNLIWGDVFHKGLEYLIEIPYQREEFTPEDWGRVLEAVQDRLKNEWPQAEPTYFKSIRNMLTLYNDSYKADYGAIETEKKFTVEYTTDTGNFVTLRGKADGVNAEHRLLIEHKCKRKIDFNQTVWETPHDLQVNLYCLALNTRTVIYDLIRIPDTQWALPPKRQYERPESYIDSLYTERTWGDFPIFRKKHLWIQQARDIELTDESVDYYRRVMIDPQIDRLCEYWEIVNDPNFDFQNPKHFSRSFYKTPIRHFDASRTLSYKGPYWNHRVGQLELEDLIPVTSFYSELEDD